MKSDGDKALDGSPPCALEVDMIRNAAARGHRLPCRAKSKKGQTLAEYALILSVISVIAILVLGNLSQEIRRAYGIISNQLACAISAIY